MKGNGVPSIEKTFCGLCRNVEDSRTSNVQRHLHWGVLNYPASNKHWEGGAPVAYGTTIDYSLHDPI